jgi:hypothetical protein
MSAEVNQVLRGEADTESAQRSQRDNSFVKTYLLSKAAEIARDEATPLDADAFRDGQLAQTISTLRIAVNQRIDRTRPPLIDRGIRESLTDAEIGAEIERAIADALRERNEQVHAEAKRGVKSGSTQSDLEQPQNVWPEPEVLPGALPPVPAFDERLLPDALQWWIVDMAERAQAPLDYPAAGAIVALSSALGRRCGIKPKREDDWLVVPNLWGMIIGPPAFLKSPMLHEILKPLARLEAQASEENKRALAEYEVESLTTEAERKRLFGAYSRSKSTISRADLVEELTKLKVEAPVPRRYIVNDPTVEKIGEILNQNPRGVLLSRDEIAGWLATLERAGHENDRAFYLEAWNGYSRYTYDRISRDRVEIEAACVSILGAITPGPLGAYLGSVSVLVEKQKGVII